MLLLFQILQTYGSFFKNSLTTGVISTFLVYYLSCGFDGLKLIRHSYCYEIQLTKIIQTSNPSSSWVLLIWTHFFSLVRSSSSFCRIESFWFKESFTNRSDALERDFDILRDIFENPMGKEGWATTLLEVILPPTKAFDWESHCRPSLGVCWKCFKDCSSCCWPSSFFKWSPYSSISRRRFRIANL